MFQLWEQQKQLEEQRREKERLEALRKKDKHDHSAVASTEVKQRLQVIFLIQMKKKLYILFFNYNFKLIFSNFFT